MWMKIQAKRHGEICIFLFFWYLCVFSVRKTHNFPSENLRHLCPKKLLRFASLRGRKENERSLKNEFEFSLQSLCVGLLTPFWCRHRVKCLPRWELHCWPDNLSRLPCAAVSAKYDDKFIFCHFDNVFIDNRQFCHLPQPDRKHLWNCITFSLYTKDIFIVRWLIIMPFSSLSFEFLWCACSFSLSPALNLQLWLYSVDSTLWKDPFGFKWHINS